MLRAKYDLFMIELKKISSTEYDYEEDEKKSKLWFDSRFNQKGH